MSLTGPLVLSLLVAGAASLLAVPLGTWLGWWLHRTRSRWRTLVDALVLVPLVLPPSVTGWILLKLTGREGPVGALADAVLGFGVAFTPAAAVLAAAVVALPLMAKGAQAAFATTDAELLEVAWTLGLSSREAFVRVMAPAAARGLVAAAVLTFARAIGEFGATLVVAGNLPGRTQTLPLAVWTAHQLGEDGAALRGVLVLGALSVVVAVAAQRLTRGRG